MNKLLKSRRALSPVIASIILVAVTVAVSIAVAAWMGALTFSFTKTDQFTVKTMAFYSTSGASPYSQINMTIQNTGSSSWTIVSPATVNSLTNVVVSPNWYNSTLTTMTCKAGGIIYIKLATTCTTGNNYAATVFLSDGNKITYTAPAP
jgi:flagellin-like protein